MSQRSPTKRFSQAEERLSQDVTQGDTDEFRILIASDIHLGYAEKDPIRGKVTCSRILISKSFLPFYYCCFGLLVMTIANSNNFH